MLRWRRTKNQEPGTFFLPPSPFFILHSLPCLRHAAFSSLLVCHLLFDPFTLELAMATTALLLAALALPVVLFWLLRSRSRLNPLVAAALAVATGWALNVAWAFASQDNAAND